MHTCYVTRGKSKSKGKGKGPSKLKKLVSKNQDPPGEGYQIIYILISHPNHIYTLLIRSAMII